MLAKGSGLLRSKQLMLEEQEVIGKWRNPHFKKSQDQKHFYTVQMLDLLYYNTPWKSHNRINWHVVQWQSISRLMKM